MRHYSFGISEKGYEWLIGLLESAAETSTLPEVCGCFDALKRTLKEQHDTTWEEISERIKSREERLDAIVIGKGWTL
jgi:hypothetical protein